MKMRKRLKQAFVMIAMAIGIALLPLAYQNFSIFHQVARLGVSPNVCHIEPGAGTCSVEINWEAPA